MIHECRELVSTSNAVSPYVRIIVNGIEKFKSSVMKKKTDPKFEEPYEIVVLDKTTFFIRAEVRDSAAEDKLVGAFTSYLSDIVRQQQKNDSWWDLVNESEQTGQLRLSAEWKPMVMSGISDFVNRNGFDSKYFGLLNVN